VIDVSVLQLLPATVTGWLDRREREALAYLIVENRLLRRQLGRKRLRLTDNDRRRVAAHSYRLGRQRLHEIATIVTPDTLLRWHRRLIARKWTYAKPKPSRCGVLAEIRCLVVRMADEDPTWGYTRIQGALKNVGHRVGGSTVARILKSTVCHPCPRSWQIFLRAHWVAIGSAEQWDNTGLGRAGRLVFWPAASRPPAAFGCSAATAVIVAAIARAALHVVSRLSCVSAKVSKQTSDSLFRSQ
jgi:hypothetical protein